MFSWDAKKALANLQKHSVSFEEAATIFSDLQGLDWQDFESSLLEKRSKRLGTSLTGRQLLVVYTIRR